MDRKDAITKARERIKQLKEQRAKNARTENPYLNKPDRNIGQYNPYLEQTSTTHKSSYENKRLKGLQFNEPGKYIALGEQHRKQLKMEELKRKIAQRNKEAGLEPDSAIGENLYKQVQPVGVEWWDLPLVSNYNEKADLSVLNDLIQHPIPIMAPWEKHLPPMKPLFLTKKEVKRLRRNNRKEKLNEYQEKIKQGLLPKPEPKVKLSNLMNVLTNEAIADPTEIEKRVREQVEQRKQQHEQDNENRKLSKEQRHEKIEAAKHRDIERGLYSAVFHVNLLEHPSHRFKVDQNAVQLGLVGCAVITPEKTLIIVEGGEKAVNQYKKLVLRRIHWDDTYQKDGVDVQLQGNTARLVWEGSLRERNFTKWTMHRLPTSADAAQFLRSFRCEHYWRQS